MNTNKQFWALFKYQQTVNPVLIFMPLIFAMPLLMPFFLRKPLGHDYHPSLSVLLSNQGFYVVGIIAVMWLAPEMFRRGAANSVWSDGTEFILTRAVDRRIVVRARLVFFYLLVLIVPLGILSFSVGRSELTISEHQKAMQQQVLEKMPGSVLVPGNKEKAQLDSIVIPDGEVLISGWRLCLFVLSAATLQCAIFLVYPWKYRKTILWGLYIGILFTPLLWIGGMGSDQLTLSQKLFFFYIGHKILCWAGAVAALLLGQAWSEWRFSRAEQTT